MKLSQILAHIPKPYMLCRDGEFSLLEQCTKIRAPGALTYLDREKFLPALGHPDISCVICTPELREKIPAHIEGIVTAENPKLIFFLLHNYLVEQAPKKETVIDKTAIIHPTAVIASRNVEIGPNVVIGANAVIEENCILKKNVHIGANSTVGAQNFDVIRDGDTQFMAKNGGWAQVDEGVEIASGTQIEGATLTKDVTRICPYVKIDNNVLIGHGSTIGARTLIAAMTIISGNVSIGEDVFLGVGTVISNRIVIADRARISLGSVVTKDVPADQTVTGNFAIPHQKFLKNLKKSIQENE